MTLLQIINIIKDTALAQPNVNTFVRNFLDLNREDTKYSAIVLQDRDGQRDRISEQDWNTFTFHLGYVDRLTFDEANRDDIFSTGINIINNIVASIRQTWFPDMEVNLIDRFSTFDQRFTASCAGVYVVLAIQIPVSDCVDSEQTNIYDTYQAKFTENGHYHYVPDGKPYGEIDITIDVEGGGEKPEETLTETIITNGNYHYDPTPGYVFSGADISVNVPTEAVLKKFSSYAPIDKHTGGFFLEPSDIERLGADGLNEVELEYGVAALTLDPTITTNGSYQYEDPDSYYYNANITVDVHPSQSLVETITTNGSHTYTGEWNGAEITVAVPVPSMSTLTQTLTSNSTYTYTASSGEAYDNVIVTVSVPSDIKPETICDEIIQENGSHHYTPPTGEVFSEVHITTDVHPSQSLSRSYTTNGTKTITGEFNGGTININVHPSTSLSETYTSNGIYNIQGEYSGGTVTVAVSGGGQKPEESLIQTISSNGSYHYDPTPGSVFSGADITVAVPATTTVTMTQSQYDALTVKDSNTIYLING